VQKIKFKSFVLIIPILIFSGISFYFFNLIFSTLKFDVSKNKNFKKIQEILVDNFKNLQLAPHVVEELVQSHYKENKKIKNLKFLRKISIISNKYLY